MQDKKHEEDKIEHKINTMNEEELHEEEDDLGMLCFIVDFEDQFTKMYVENRMKELKARAKEMKYGQVFEISRDQYIKHVTEADPESFVILHLYQPSN